MKALLPVLFLCATPSAAFFAQSSTAPDTLIHERFVDNQIPLMLLFPTGHDENWVNYDADQIMGLCVESEPTPFGWYLDSDLGVSNPNQTTNDAFTSCSFLANPNKPNENWLITSPIVVPDSAYWLCWRSLTYYGPGFHDGYKVLASTTSNNPADIPFPFSKTLFKAAEMVEQSAPVGSLDVEDYVFSEGYIHANGYTDTAYFFIDFSEGPPFYHGKMEPHMVSLAEFAGDTIYIAFLHDSQDDYQLQVDDIVVSKTHISTTHSAPLDVVFFNISPNPVQDGAYVFWKMKNPQRGRVIVADNTGKTMFQKLFDISMGGRFFLETQGWPSGIYHCTLETAAGRATSKLVKL